MVKVAVDIGHGSNTFPPSKGVYNGGKGYAEHDFNAKLGVRIKDILEANGVKVILGQQPGKPDVNLTTRTNLYNREGVDLVFSVHANAGGGTGRCAFYWHSSSASKRAAEMVIKHIKAKGYSTHGNGLHASEPGSWTNLHICRETKSPAVIVEHGFMDTPEDFELIFGNKQAKYVEDMAQADSAAILEYLSVKGNVSITKPKKPSTGSEQIKKPAPKPSKPNPSSSGGSLVDYLKSIGQPSSFSARKKLAKQYGILNYKGTAKQNTDLLAKLKAGKPKSKKPTKALPNAVYRASRPYPSGSGVKAVQKALAAKYFYPNKGAKNNGIDGVYGPKTADAVRRFQSMNGLTADGVYGPKTRAKLEK